MRADEHCSMTCRKRKLKCDEQVSDKKYPQEEPQLIATATRLFTMSESESRMYPKRGDRFSPSAERVNEQGRWQHR